MSNNGDIVLGILREYSDGLDAEGFAELVKLLDDRDAIIAAQKLKTTAWDAYRDWARAEFETGVNVAEKTRAYEIAFAQLSTTGATHDPNERDNAGAD